MHEFLSGFAILISYFIVCASAALLLRRFFRIPTELFRKILHAILVCSLLVWVYAFTTWWISALAAAAFIALVYPILALAEHIEGYSRLLTERKQGEIKNSLVVVFTMFIVMISLCWGWLDDQMLVLACVFAWGFGDAAAALVGKRYGRHYLEGKHIEGRKSAEGTLSMFIVSFMAVAVVLILRGGLYWYAYLVISLIAAAVCALTELYTRNGMDTITCPLAAATVILPLVQLWGGAL